MEGIGNQGRYGLILLLVLVMGIPVLMIQDKCPLGEYETDEGICCNKCLPGFKLLEKCRSSEHRSKCIPCNDGEFLEQENFSDNCRTCRRCKAKLNEYEASSCRRDINTICLCKEGYYKDYIGIETYECRKCRKCETEEIQKQPCTHEKDTVCECKENYYRLNGKCKPCSRCTPECTHHCLTTAVRATGPENHHPQFINVVVGSVVIVLLLLALGIFITYMATKSFFKKKMLSQLSDPSVYSKESSKDFLVNVIEPLEGVHLKTVVETPLGVQDLPKLPDCVPMIPDLIYAVLDLVPVYQVKQLVRSLCVTDTEIEQAEMDHRSCREAHYQMLRVWARRGSRTVQGGEGETVHQPLLDELLEKLRRIHLSRVAEELETKYAIQ